MSIVGCGAAGVIDDVDSGDANGLAVRAREDIGVLEDIVRGPRPHEHKPSDTRGSAPIFSRRGQSFAAASVRIRSVLRR